MNTLKNKILTPLIAVSLFAGGATGVAALASAQTATTGSTTTTTTSDMHEHMGPGVMGTVSAVSGNTVTVTGKDSTSYTVDVSNTKIMIGSGNAAPTTGSVSDIKVGDTVGVRGTVSGTSVTATEVMDGFMMHGMGGPGGHGRGPGVMGTVSAVSGNTVTVTKTDGTTYTIDASNAKVSKIVDLAVSDIKVGDTVGVEGTVSGSSVTATHIMDGVPPQPTTTTTQSQ